MDIDELNEFNEVKEVKSAEEAQQLLKDYWHLIDTGKDEVYEEFKGSDTIPLFNKITTFRFVLGRIKPIVYPTYAYDEEGNVVKVPVEGMTKEEFEAYSK